MIHNTLSALLVSVASRYAQLSPSDLGIGINGGRLVVDNVKLRTHVFNGPNVPFHVHQGRAGRLRVNVPWSALSSAPVEVYFENVHLIAEPKSTNPENSSPPPDIPLQKEHWHQTLLGRLLFNVSVEMYGLKVEYRDKQCNAIISIASLRAFSVGTDGKAAFVSLASDSHSQYPHSTTAVAMRKVLKLNGVHWVMIPRVTQNQPPSEHHDHPIRNLDLDSYESKSPILDGIAITIKVLCCTGTALIDSHSEQLTPGLHAEIDVEVEEPNINLTASQLKWIDAILKTGFGIGHTPTSDSSYATTTSPTKRRPRNSATISTNVDSSTALDVEHTPSEPTFSETALYFSDNNLVKVEDSHVSSRQNADFIEQEEDQSGIDPANDDHDDDSDTESKENEDSTTWTEAKRKGRLSSFWQAIVSENSDETVDDAAIALGLLEETQSTNQDVPAEADEEDLAEIAFAREAVNAAAKAGGLTFKLRVKTPDVTAWDLVEQLRDQLTEEREVRKRLENIEDVLEEAEKRVNSSEMETISLRKRNVELMNELKDLERMTGEAGKNKDAMIRQMEAALMKAERNLQAMFQVQFEQKEAEKRQRQVEQERGEYSSSGSSVEESYSREMSGSAGGGTEIIEESESSNDTLVRHSDVELEEEEVSSADEREELEIVHSLEPKEMYFTKAASKQLEEAISSEGLTLI